VRPGLLCIAALSIACVGCIESRSCTLELRYAVIVRIENPQGLTIDSVTAKRSHEQDCTSYLGGADASTGDSHEVGYSCFEDGGGTYVVRVESGRSTWTQKVHINANACHTTERKTLTFVLDPKTADSTT
jgi:hypothetical protein